MLLLPGVCRLVPVLVLVLVLVLLLLLGLRRLLRRHPSGTSCLCSSRESAA